MCRDGMSGCDGLLLLSALVSIQISRQVNEEQLSLLAAFFTVLGDDLALLALCPGRERSESQEVILP